MTFRTTAALTAVLLLSACSGGTGPEAHMGSYANATPTPVVEASSNQNADDGEGVREDNLAGLRRLLDGLRRDLDAAMAYLASLTADEAAEEPDLGSAQHMPVVDLDATTDRYERTLTGVRHIGADVAPLPAGTNCNSSGDNPVLNARWCGTPTPRHNLPRAADHAGVTVSYGKIRDGVGKDQVVAWLREHAIATEEWIPGLLTGLQVHTDPLTVRIVENATDEQREWVLEAVQAINASLPHEWKLSISDEPVPLLAIRSSASVADGEIHVRFDSGHNHHFALAVEGGVLIGGMVIMNPSMWPYGRAALAYGPELDRRQTAVGILVHEMLHSMGFLDHPDMVSVMSYSRELTGYAGLPGHYMYPLDREGVLAAYTRLKRGVRPRDIATELGPWSDTSIHVRGVLDLSGTSEMAFGAAHRNGFVQPWAYGPAPDSDLADNAALSGSASWSGRLLGLTPEAAAVAGAADMTISLATLNGDLDFTKLESWAANVTPGAIGTGTTWGDGDLGYAISVHGNTFVQTGGDAGNVTGAFFGDSHEAMGGTLERDDLAAGFGGRRQ